MSEEDPIVVGQETILEGALPEQAINSGSLAEFAAKTQQDWEDELRGNEITRWEGGVLDGLYTGLQQGKPFVVALVQAIVKEVFGGNPNFADAQTAFEQMRTNFDLKWQDLIAATALAGTAKDKADVVADDAVEIAELVDDVIGAGSNIIANPSFERLRFQQTGSSFSTDYARSGVRSLRIIGNGTSARSYLLLSDDNVPRVYSVTEEDMFYAEVWVRAGADNSQTSGAEGSVRLLFEPFSGNYQPLTPIAVSTGPSQAAKDGWVQIAGYVPMPPLARWLTMKLQITSAINDNERWYFDDVVVREVSVAAEANAAAGTAQTQAETATFNAGAAQDLADEIVESGSNLIINAGFENTRYEQAGSTFSTDYPRYGARSLRIQANGSSAKSYTLLADGATPRLIKADAGDVFWAEVWVRGHPNNTQTSGGTNGVRMLLEPLNKLGATLTPSSLAINASTAYKTDWYKLEGFVTMPPDTANLRVKLEVSAAVNDNEVWFFDDVSLREVTLAKEATAAAGTAQAAAETANQNALDADELAGAVVASGGNIIVNPGFEAGVFAQGVATFTTNANEVRTGSRALKLTRTALVSNPTYYLLSDDNNTRFVPVVGDDIFYAEVWVRGAQANSQVSGGTGGVRMVFEPFSGFTALTGPGDVVVLALNANQALKSGWTKISGYVPVPATATRMRVSLQLTSQVSAGEAYAFDDVVLREETLAKAASTAAGIADGKAETAAQNATDANDFAGQILDSGSNLIANSDFEKGLVSPQPLVATYSEEQKYSGTRSLKFTANGTIKTFYLLSEGLTPRTIPASEGDRFYCEMWVYGSGLSGSVADGLRIVFEPTNRLGANLTDSYIGQTVSSSLNGTWTKVALYTDPLPANTTKVKVAVQLRNTVTAGTIYVDQVIVREVTVAKAAEDAADLADGKALAAQQSLDTKARDLTNIAAGSDFEGSVQPWTLGTGWTIATDQKYAGTKSLKHSGNQAGTSTLPAVTACLPGEQFYVEFWARKDASFNGTTNDKLRLMNQDITEIGSVWFGSAAIASANTWTKLFTTVTVPAGTSSFTVTVVSNSTAGSVWLDNIVIRRVLTSDVVGELPQDRIIDLDTSFTTVNDTAISASDLAAVVGASNNLVVSPDFDEPTVRRFVDQSVSGFVTGSYSTDRAVTGTYSYKLLMNTAGTSGAVGELVLNPYKTDFEVVWFNIVPGQVYNYDFVYYLTGTSSKPLAFRAGYRTLAATSSAATTVASITPVKNSWQRVTGSFTIPDLVPATTGSPPLQMVVTVGFVAGAVGAAGDALYIDRCLVYLQT